MRSLMMAMVCLLCSAAVVLADDSVVAVAGSATLTKQPTVLRVSVVASGEGKDLAEAMGKLAKSRDELKAKLAGLKPVEGSLTVGEATMADAAMAGMTVQQRQYRAMLNLRNGGQKAPAAPAVTASAMITANFAIPAAAGDDAIVKASELEKQIKAAVTPAAAPGEAKKLTAEEQEMADELAAVGGQGGGKPGEPTITYVLTVTDEEAAKLATEAIGKANGQAKLLAAAAGMKLGGIRKLSAEVTGGASADDMMGGMSGVFRSAMGVAADVTREATGTAPGPVSYTVTVSVNYELTK